jgi:hypothetical protein
VTPCTDKSAAPVGSAAARDGQSCARPRAFGVILARGGQHLARLGLFHLFAAQEHLDAVGGLRDHGQIMGDVDRGRVELPDDVADRGQNLDLRRHVQRGRGLVKDDQVGRQAIAIAVIARCNCPPDT